MLECLTIRCPAKNLVPGTTYSVSASAITGSTTAPVANVLPLIMPDANAPTLVSAVDTSSTTGTATAAPPAGVTFDKVRCC